MKGSEMIFLIATIVLAPHISEKFANDLALFLALLGLVLWVGE